MIENNHNIENINLFKYLLLFTIVSLLTIFGLRSVDLFSDYKEVIIESTLILVIPSLYTVFKFVQENKRIPTKSEKRKLVSFSIVLSWLILGILVLSEIYYYDGSMQSYFLDRINYVDKSTSLLVIVGIIYITLLSFVMYVVYTISYGWLGKLFIKESL